MLGQTRRGESPLTLSWAASPNLESLTQRAPQCQPGAADQALAACAPRPWAAAAAERTVQVGRASTAAAWAQMSDSSPAWHSTAPLLPAEAADLAAAAAEEAFAVEEAALASRRRRPPPLEPPPTVESPLVLTELLEVGLAAGGVVVDGGDTTGTFGGAGEAVAAVAAVVAATAFFFLGTTVLTSMLQHLSGQLGKVGEQSS